METRMMETAMIANTALVGRFLMGIWWRVIMMIVPTNGFIGVVLGSRVSQRESGIVPSADREDSMVVNLPFPMELAFSLDLKP